MQPLLLHRFLERQVLVLRDELGDGRAHQAAGQADHDLVLQDRVAEMQEGLPAGPGCPEISRSVRGRVGEQVRVPAQQRGRLIGPGPAAQPGNDGQLREVAGDLIKIAGMAKVIRPVIRVVHRRVDTHRYAEVDAPGIQRVIAPVAGREHIGQCGDHQAGKVIFADEPL